MSEFIYRCKCGHEWPARNGWSKNAGKIGHSPTRRRCAKCGSGLITKVKNPLFANFLQFSEILPNF